MSERINWTEKRRVKRRDILERFSFYVCLPKLGYSRHRVNDVSELGIGFLLETFGEFKLDKQELCELQFYLNQSLFIPLKIKVVRTIDREEGTQEVGAIFEDENAPEVKTFETLVHLVDQLSETVTVI